MKNRRTMYSVLAGGALAALVPLTPAVASQSPPQSPPDPVIKIGRRATLQAGGAAIIVPIKVTCARGATDPAWLDVTVNERVGNRIVRGQGSTHNVRCNDSTQRVKVPTLASEHPFRPGIAFGVADFTVCYPSGCLSAEDYREIRIVR